MEEMFGATTQNRWECVKRMGVVEKVVKGRKYAFLRMRL